MHCYSIFVKIDLLSSTSMDFVIFVNSKLSPLNIFLYQYENLRILKSISNVLLNSKFPKILLFSKSSKLGIHTHTEIPFTFKGYLQYVK